MRDCLASPTVQVALGAAVGAVARYGLAALLPGALGLLCINVLGCALMGRLAPPPWLGTGVLGGFTSFSTFLVVLSQASLLLGGAYALGTITLCVGAWLAGDAARRRR